ncbi:MAG: hypothetical protein RR614_03585 [Eubacterium sp.]
MNDTTKQTATPMSALLFMFSTSCFILWGLYQGIFSGEIRLLYGLIALAMYPVYMIGGIWLLRKNESYSANLFFIFGVLFTGMMAFSNIAMFFSDQFGWGYDRSILAIPLLISGIGVTPSMIPYRFAPAIPFLTWSIACIWLMTSALEMLGVPALMLVNQILAFVVGAGVLYMMIDELLKSIGEKGLPLGKPLFKKKLAD